MISKITPEDRETWDKKMKDHSRRIVRPERRRSNVGLMLTGFVIGWLIVTAWNTCNKLYTPPRTPEQVMGDTLRIEQHKTQEEGL